MAATTVTDRQGTPTSPQRRFSVLDAMILVAATALGFAIVQWTGQASHGQVSLGAFGERCRTVVELYSVEDQRGAADEIAVLGLMTSWLIMPVVASWTLALIPIRLLGPKPGRARLARQPGLMANFAAGGTIVFLGVSFVVVLTMELDQSSDSMDGAFFFAPLFVGWAVLISWTTLLLGGRCAPKQAGSIGSDGPPDFSGF